MKYLLFISFTITAFVNATSPLLSPRQELCPTDNKVCGEACIPESWSCCAPYSGGCEPGFRCTLDDFGDPGCCEKGKVCTGAFGGTTIIADTVPTDTADVTDTDDVTTTTSDVAPTKTTDPETGEEKPPNEGKPSAAAKPSDDSSSGASDRLDSAVSYLLVGAMVLLI